MLRAEILRSLVFCYSIEGGHRLSGQIEVSGSKNAALAIIGAAMALDGPCLIHNLPNVRDVCLFLEVCSDIGAQVEKIGAHKVRIDPTTITGPEAISPKVAMLRGSYYLLGALQSRFGVCKVTMPGGCNLGVRPIDLHLKGFMALGSEVDIIYRNINCEEIWFHYDGGAGSLPGQDGPDAYTLEPAFIYCQNPAGKMEPASVFLDTVSVGATVNIMIAAVKADGITVIDNAAREPHIVDVANFLNTMGADIRGAGTETIRIKGKPYLPADKEYTIIPDQIEAGTYMMMAPLTGGDITVNNIIPTHMEPLSAKLLEMGVIVEEGEESIRVSAEPGRTLKPTSIKTMPYPGFPTDLQPQVTALLCTAGGTSRVIETVWESRYGYVTELAKLGANVVTSGRLAVITGGGELTGTRVRALDLRGGMAVTMAGLAARGETIVENISVIERGYEDAIDKISSLGGVISRYEVETGSYR